MALVKISVQLTPKGARTHIKMGDVNGIIENILANSPFGDWKTTDCAMIIPKTNGMLTGNINCCTSVSWFTAEPIAAKTLL